MSNLGAQLSDTSDFGLSTDSILTRPLKGSDAKGKGVWKPRPEVVEDRNAWARLLSTTNEVSRETTEMTFRDLKLRTYVGHSSRVNVVAQDECSRLLGTGSRDRTVKLWSLNSIHRDIEHGIGASEAAHTYTGHQRTVTDVCFLENSVASCDGAIHLWSVESGQLLHQFEGKSRVVSVISSPTTVIGATVDNFLSFWNLRDPVRTHRWRAGNAHAGNIRCIAMCPAERTVVVGFATGVCSLLDRRTGMILASWRAHEGEVSQVAFYTTRFVVTSCGADRAINIWDTTNLTSVRTFRDSNEIASFEVQEDDLVILGAAGNGLNFVSLSSNFQSYFAKLKTRSPITSMGLARLNGLFALGCAEGEVVVYA
ncbi:WD40-repeat-containing domain protein [Hyaloraphidium curvatum]|nr:WD40-repeat-containing domain protein [Hyaloraphidium curvatum]